MTTKLNHIPTKLKRVFSLRLPDIIYAKLSHIADIEYRSMSNLIEFIVVQYISNYEAKNGLIELNEDDV